MSARTALRNATAAQHERVDRLFSSFDLGRRDGYRHFLLAQAAAFLPAENALDAAGAGNVIADWPSRRRGELARADLVALETPLPAFATPPELHGTPGILGAIYVLEGSRLGGAVLKRRLPSALPSAFLGAPAPRGSWRKLLETLDECLTESTGIEEAIASAKEVFVMFEAAARRHAGGPVA